MRYKLQSQGFALPMVIISSVVLFAVLVAAVGSVASMTISLDTQYYESLASDAAESGSAQVNSCLQANNFVSSWGSKNLTPATDCTGTVVSGQSKTVVASPTYSSSYSVSPITSSATGTQTATITGTVGLLRSSGVVWKTYAKTLMIKTGGQVGTSQVVFGYVGGSGAFFGTVGGDGVMRTVGFNGQAQLGSGSFTSTLTPKQFQTPAMSRIVAGFANFVSVGYRMYALDSNGVAYGAGYNGFSGELGVGLSAASRAYVPTPMPVVMPAGKQIRYILPGTADVYFITTDNNVYASGQCSNGQLGSNYAISGCADQPTPVRVNLPTPNIADPNTIPTNNIASDRADVYIRMAGGAVYGWGANDWAQLGGDNFTPQSNPTLIGTYGSTGSPAAMQVMTDGATAFILDSNGQVNSIGLAHYGQMGNSTMSLVMKNGSGKCMDNTNADGTSIALNTCNGTPAQKYQLRADSSVYNANKNVCLNNKDSDGVTLKLATCNGTAAQKFVWNPDAGTLYNASTNKCVDNQGGNGVTLWLYSCNGTGSQYFLGYNGALTPFDTSGILGSITKIWTDQGSLSALTSNGEIWSAGLNSKGQFGNGTATFYQPTPVKFNIPVPAVDLYETLSGSSSSPYQNLYAVGSDGRVYGSGSNTFGQLGNGTTSNYSMTPIVMSVIDGANIAARQVQSGFGTTVIFTTNGTVYTVGNNGSGQLGDGTTNNSSTPINAKYINNLKAITY